jgi:hypothetical protein
LASLLRKNWNFGVTPSALDGLAFDWPEWGSPPPAAPARLQGLGEQALRARSDLAGAIEEYAAAENRLHQAVVRQYPQFQLSPGYYWDHGIAKFPFDVGFTLPLFNRSEGEIAQARAAREVAGQRMLAVQAEIIGAIAAAERGEQVAHANLAAAEHGFDAARRQREHAALSLRLAALPQARTPPRNSPCCAVSLKLRRCARIAGGTQRARDALRAAVGAGTDLARPLPAGDHRSCSMNPYVRRFALLATVAALTFSSTAFAPIR